MSRHSDHAETYLRLLAEAALRATPRAADSAERAARARRAAGLLVDAGVLDDTRANEILIMLAAALSVRGRSVRGQRGWLAPGPVLVTADRIIAPATLRFPPSAGLTDLAAPSFADLTARDDTGASYRVNFTEGGWAGSTWTGIILFRPPPSPAARLLTVSGPNGPVLRAQLTPDPAAGQPVATVTPLADSPGERLLIRRAEALLGALADPDSPGRHRYLDAPTARRAAVAQVMRPFAPGFPGTAPLSPASPSPVMREPDLAEAIEVLEGARILSPLSPIPGRVAALSRALGLPSTTRSSEKLPARWREVLAYYGRRGHEPLAAGTGSIGVTLPAVDGARFVVAGVHTGRAGTVLHVVGRGLRPMSRPGQDSRFSWWLRDESGTWHLAIAAEGNVPLDDLPMGLALLPPLRPGDPGSTGTLTLEVSGATGQLTADVTVYW